MMMSPLAKLRLYGTLFPCLEDDADHDARYAISLLNGMRIHVLKAKTETSHNAILHVVDAPVGPSLKIERIEARVEGEASKVAVEDDDIVFLPIQQIERVHLCFDEEPTLIRLMGREEFEGDSDEEEEQPEAVLLEFSFSERRVSCCCCYTRHRKVCNELLEVDDDSVDDDNSVASITELDELQQCLEALLHWERIRLHDLLEDQRQLDEHQRWKEESLRLIQDDEEEPEEQQNEVPKRESV